jgi:polyhydroxyalkanoate synthesis repressor PhaR
MFRRIKVMTAADREEHDRECCTMSDIVPIKRYPNRRFYDRKSRKYVTLQEIEDLVRGGQTIEVKDSRNDEDLTRVVLTQILLERHPERMDLFPISLLHIMLRANDVALEFLRVFLRLSLVTLENLQGSRTMSPFVSPFDWMRMFFSGFAPITGPRTSDEAPATTIKSPENTIKSPEATIEQLSRHIAELEARLRRLELTAPPATGQSVLPGFQQRQVRGLEDRSSKDRPSK